MKRQITHLKKIFASLLSNRGLVSRIYKEFLILNMRKKKQTSSPIRK